MRLYDIGEQYNDIIDLLEEDSTNEALQSMMDGLEIEFDKKVESIAKLMKSKQAEYDALLAESKRLGARAEKVEKEQQWLHTYIQDNMVRLKKEEVKSILFKIAFQNNPPSVNVINESFIPAKYFVQPPLPEKKLDKITLLKDLKNNIPIEGAEIKKTQRLVIK